MSLKFKDRGKPLSVVAGWNSGGTESMGINSSLVHQV